jgi:preprotein translocase subunit SecA
MDWDTFSDKLSTLGENLGRGLKGLFGSHTERQVRKLGPLVGEVAALEEWAKGLEADEFKRETAQFREALKAGQATLDSIMPKAFALVREASRRTLGLRHFDVQIVGGVVLHEGRIAEMMTGEGKTLVATLPLYLNCLEGKPVYLVTVNDYLARRDWLWMKPIYDFLGVTSGAIQSQMGAWERQPVYACDIVYGTNNEFGFDYLRDNMKTRLEDQVQRFLHFAIVDEVDSILIDEARTPLIISGPAEQSSDKYKLADRAARSLVAEEHYEVKEKERTVSILEAGIAEAERLVGVESFYTPGNEDWPHFIENALRAKELYHLDDQYVIEPNEKGEPEVVIVDEFTGRKMHGRRWSDGLHQAVETKEGLTIRQENQTLATITFQNYFRLFKKLAGMTGTALTEAAEFYKIYRLDVVQIPSNLPVVRLDGHDVVYRTEPEKWKSVVEEIGRLHQKGQPVLVGTTSVEKSEKLSGLLQRRGIRHEVLNAKNHEREAAIVAHAGEKAAVTVATNMAGRGTDIKLGGNFEWRLKAALQSAGLVEGDPQHLADIDRVREEVRAQCERDEADVLELGGLYVLGSERHEARRIDNQLRGRSGRQGDVGESRFYLSLEDDLMRRFYRDWVKNAMEKLGMTEGQEIESGMVTRAIERAQRKVEDYNFEVRKSLLEYDEVMDSQRKTIYSMRQQVLESVGLREKVEGMLQTALDRAADVHKGDAPGLIAWFQRSFALTLDPQVAELASSKMPETARALEQVRAHYDEREKELSPELMRRIEQYVLLNVIDTRWKDHLHAIDALKTGIGLRGYGQLDPKNEYKREGFQLFEQLKGAIEDEVAALILRIQVRRPPEAPPGAQVAVPRAASPTAMQMSGPAKTAAAVAPPPPQRRVVAPRPISPSQAFDLKRRADAIQALQRAQEQRQQQGQQSAAQAPAPGAPPAADGQAPPVASQQAPSASVAPAPAAGAVPPGVRPAPKAAFEGAGRNDPCPCGSGKKFKKCHGQ